MNIKAVLLHYLGDALSSLIVMIAGLINYFVPDQESWTKYIDPFFSLVIVALILWTTLPLLRSGALILLQQVPNRINVSKIKDKLLKIKNVFAVHDLHVWQLVDNMTIASLHVVIKEEPSINLSSVKMILDQVKSIFHKFGVHSITIQPEFVPSFKKTSNEECDQNCVKNCPEDWCCKDEGDNNVQYETFRNN
eukprot:TRINITY_DN2595_c1_g1_i2.p2 TRINITY_DN2595_c1_g1~~TRINITY_DN2595_c1_g1_i2.p2  ORF type:complete len:193 (+),score=33.92 TRINITY_DN2595_c1_g1_i2:922-1500(+)